MNLSILNEVDPGIAHQLCGSSISHALKKTTKSILSCCRQRTCGTLLGFAEVASFPAKRAETGTHLRNPQIQIGSRPARPYFTGKNQAILKPMRMPPGEPG